MLEALALWSFYVFELTGNLVFDLYEVISHPKLLLADNSSKKRKRANAEEKRKKMQKKGDGRSIVIKEQYATCYSIPSKRTPSDSNSIVTKPTVSRSLGVVSIGSDPKISHLEAELSKLRAQIASIAMLPLPPPPSDDNIPSLPLPKSPSNMRQVADLANAACREESESLQSRFSPLAPSATSSIALLLHLQSHEAPLPPPISLDDNQVSEPVIEEESHVSQEESGRNVELDAAIDAIEILTEESTPSSMEAPAPPSLSHFHNFFNEIAAKKQEHIARRSVTRVITATGRSFSLQDLVEGSTSLRKIEMERSPGGTPIRTPISPSSAEGAQGALARALKEKFSRVNESPDSEKWKPAQDDDGWYDERDVTASPLRSQSKKVVNTDSYDKENLGFNQRALTVGL